MHIEKLWQDERVRFVCAGLIGFSVCIFLLYALTEWYGWWYGTSVLTALVVDYTVTFFLQKILTFGDRSTHVLFRQIGKFVLMNIGFYVANYILMLILVGWLGWWYIVSQCLISAGFTIISFKYSSKLFNP